MDVHIREVALGAQHPDVYAIVAVAPDSLEVWVNIDSNHGSREGTDSGRD